MLYTLANYSEVLFSTTDNEDFLLKCETLYNDISDDSWESYTNLSELPTIFENHGYDYLETEQNKILKIDDFNKFVNVFFKLQLRNPTINFDNGKSLVLATNRLLNYHNEATTKWVKDSEDKVTLLNEIVGGNGFDQLEFHKSFRDTWNVSIY